MPATEAQISANRMNSLKSTGPKTAEGKEASRANAYKHGLTGSGVVIPECEAVEVERRAEAFAAELKPSGEVGRALVLHAARMSVRLERCAHHETAVSTERVRRAIADFVPLAGVGEAEANRLRAEAGTLALFETSKEATQARKYETATERSFLRALKELRILEREAIRAGREDVESNSWEPLASFSPEAMSDEEFKSMYAKVMAPVPGKADSRPDRVAPSMPRGRVDVPIMIGRRR